MFGRKKEDKKGLWRQIVFTVPVAEIKECPLYDWEHQPRRVPMSPWISYPVCAGLLALYLLGPMSFLPGFRPLVSALGLLAYTFFAVVWEWRTLGYWDRWRESGGLRDLYLSGQRPEVILAAFNRAQIVQFYRSGWPWLVLLLMIVFDLVGQTPFGAAGFAGVIMVALILTVVRARQTKGIHQMRLVSVFWLTAKKTPFDYIMRFSGLVGIIGLPILTVGGPGFPIFIGIIYLGLGFRIVRERRVRKMTEEQVHEYLDAWFREDQEAMGVVGLPNPAPPQIDL